MKTKLRYLWCVAACGAISVQAASETETIRGLRVVDWGQLSGRFFEETSFTEMPDGTRRLTNIYDQDLDGDPKTPDRIETTFFSLTNRLSPESAAFDDTWVSGIFYGGATFYYYNRPKALGGGISEFYNNSCETVTDMQPSADFAVHMDNPKNCRYRGYFAPIWIKKDFPHLGTDGRVSFDNTSLFIINQQRHYGGYDGVRFVARNGDQFYLSEICKENWANNFDIKSYCPAKVKWGKWNPQEGGHDLRFNPDTPMEPVTFNNVTAAGFYVFKDSPDAVQTAWKWEAFEVYATVTRTKIPSECLDMKKVETGTVPPFYMTTREISYHEWRKNFKWSESVGVFAHTFRGFLYDRNGDMGSMDDGFLPHHHDEPVTDMSLRDMLAWCNALSEFEGREPVYYTDAAFTKPFTDVILNPWWINPGELPDIHVKWDADGYRLPTAAEWAAAYGGDAGDVPGKGAGTVRTGTGKPNKLGFCDLAGNVWEPVWAWGDALKAGERSMKVLGDSYAGPGIGAVTRHPSDGSPRIGLRVVRRDKGLARPALEANLPAQLVWDISADLKVPAMAAADPGIEMVQLQPGIIKYKDKEFENTIEMPAFHIGKTEVTYEQWRTVYDWALAHGYAFDRDGDMGSMYLRDCKNTHTPDEPVTRITYYDMMAWCNALSEMTGRRPVFYSDPGFKQVYRQVWRHRPSQLRYKDYEEMKIPLYSNNSEGKQAPGSWVWPDFSADGFRLPTLMEWHIAAEASLKGQPVDGKPEDCDWTSANAGMRTHPVKSKPATACGLHGLYGNALELFIDSNEKGGGQDAKRLMKQTKHPIQTFLPHHYGSRWRAAAKHFSILVNPPLSRLENPYGGLIGMYPGWGWPDTGLRVVRCEAGTYPPGGIEEGWSATDFTKIPLDRAPSGVKQIKVQ